MFILEVAKSEPAVNAEDDPVVKFVCPDTVSEESVPTEVREEEVTPDPRVLDESTDVPPIWYERPEAMFILEVAKSEPAVRTAEEAVVKFCCAEYVLTVEVENPVENTPVPEL